MGRQDSHTTWTNSRGACQGVRSKAPESRKSARRWTTAARPDGLRLRQPQTGGAAVKRTDAEGGSQVVVSRDLERDPDDAFAFHSDGSDSLFRSRPLDRTQQENPRDAKKP